MDKSLASVISIILICAVVLIIWTSSAASGCAGFGGHGSTPVTQSSGGVSVTSRDAPRFTVTATASGNNVQIYLGNVEDCCPCNTHGKQNDN